MISYHPQEEEESQMMNDDWVDLFAKRERDEPLKATTYRIMEALEEFKDESDWDTKSVSNFV